MATAPVKSPLHNFPLTFLKWGGSKNHHHHRCRRSPLDSPPPPPPSDGSHSSRTHTHPERESPKAAPEPETEPDTEGGGSDNKPWNLRPRRAPPSSASASMAANTMKAPAVDSADNLPKSARLRGFDTQGSGGGGAGERGEKRKFWIALSRDEIEEDIYALTGAKPSRRPKRRPKNVQKQLDNVFPGLWLVGLSPEVYRSLDVPPKR